LLRKIRPKILPFRAPSEIPAKSAQKPCERGPFSNPRPLIFAALALTMVVGVGVQAFAALAVHGGSQPVLPLDPLLTGTAAHPGAPEYWWLSALLLSTMIPSLINLVIGGTSLVRGVPGLSSLLLRYTHERGGVLKWDRHWIATVLTAQITAGAALGIAAQVFLVWVIIGHVMPSAVWSCSTWPAGSPTSICRRGWGSSLGSACSDARPAHRLVSLATQRTSQRPFSDDACLNVQRLQSVTRTIQSPALPF
jgi:hypothetical protein